MATDLPKSISLEAERVKDIFTDPDFNLSSKTIGNGALIETLANEMFLSGPEHYDRVTIRLQSIDAFTEQEILEGIKRYCNNKIAANKNEIGRLKKTGLTGLVYSVCITIVVILLAWLLAKWTKDFEIVSNLVVSLGVIIVWVVLWDPIELLVFNRLPLRTHNRIYKAIIKYIESGKLKILV